jgi:tyrosyl-tRNA synthetase
MVTPSLFRSIRPDLYICARCAFRTSKPSRRWVGTKYLAKKAKADEKWAELAADIRDGKKKSMFKTLEERGLIYNVTGYGSSQISKHN